MYGIQETAEVFHAIQALARENVEQNVSNLAAWTRMSERTVMNPMHKCRGLQLGASYRNRLHDWYSPGNVYSSIVVGKSSKPTRSTDEGTLYVQSTHQENIEDHYRFHDFYRVYEVCSDKT